MKIKNCEPTPLSPPEFPSFDLPHSRRLLPAPLHRTAATRLRGMQAAVQAVLGELGQLLIAAWTRTRSADATTGGVDAVGRRR